MALLEVRDLTVHFDTADGLVRAVDGISFDAEAGRTLGIVGESGSGKTQTALALMGLLPANARSRGSVRFRGEQILNLAEPQLNRIRGRQIAMIFQDPMSSLNPYLRIAKQMTEVLVHHEGMSRQAARQRCIELLDAVRIPDPQTRIDAYPHELSGGMRQRVMIAMAMLCRPDVIIADEPTTALDVTVQAEIVELMRTLRAEADMAIVLITHDLGLVAGLCDDVLVMYGGQLMEHGVLDEIFYRAQHPYTAALLQAIPRLDAQAGRRLDTVPGTPPGATDRPPGCPFFARCSHRLGRCENERPLLRSIGPSHWKACHLEALP